MLHVFCYNYGILFILEILGVSFQIIDMHLPLIGSDCCFIVPTVAWGGQSNLEVILIRLCKQETAGEVYSW